MDSLEGEHPDLEVGELERNVGRLEQKLERAERVITELTQQLQNAAIHDRRGSNPAGAESYELIPEPNLARAHLNPNLELDARLAGIRQAEIERLNQPERLDQRERGNQPNPAARSLARPQRYKRGDDICIFFERFEQYAILSGISENVDLHLLNLVEDDNMYKKLKNIATTPLHKRNVTALITALRESLFPVAESRLLRSTLTNMKQGFNEDVEAFAMKIGDIAGKAYAEHTLREEASLSTLLSGLTEVGIRQKLMESDVQTFEEATRLALKLERIARAVSEPRPTLADEADFNVFRVGPPVGKACQKCGKMYHSEENCWKDKTCQICHRKGHIDSACRSSNKTGNRASGITCYGCGEKGHYSYNCTRPNSSPTQPQQRVSQQRHLNDLATGLHPSSTSRNEQIE